MIAPSTNAAGVRVGRLSLRPGAILPLWLFLALGAALAVFSYWFLLRYWFPGYFAPISPFHTDFYEYASAGSKTISQLVLHYPRPAAYLGMRTLGMGGLSGLIAGGIAVALLSLLLTAWLARQLFNIHSPWLLGFFAVYLALLLTHPDFYSEHRHDLPAELSYLFLVSSLVAWVAWVQDRSASPGAAKYGLLGASLALAILFVFAKETYFISALCLVLGLALASRAERKLHLRFLMFLAAAEAVSLIWTTHLKSPFVGANADSSYQVSFAPSQVLQTYWFYLSHSLNTVLAVIIIWGVAACWKARREFILSAAFVLAGLSAFATHALLPNHKYEEYAWVAAPLLFAPVLRLYRAMHAFPALALASLLAALAITGQSGYKGRYESIDIRWMLDQDRRGRAMAGSFGRLKAIRSSDINESAAPPTRILVTGLNHPDMPWRASDFVRSQFGERRLWTIVLPPANEVRRGSKLVRFVDAPTVRLRDFDYVVTYDANGNLESIRKVQDIPSSEPLDEVVVPALRRPVAAGRAQPGEHGIFLQCADVAIEWGLWPQAGEFLEKARAAGGAGDPTLDRLASDLRSQAQRHPTTIPTAELVARPARIIQPDGSGLGIAELEWSVPDDVTIELRVDAPNGPLLMGGEKSGRARTGKWVRNGTTFFLQDVTAGKPLTSENTLASVTLEVAPK